MAAEIEIEVEEVAVEEEEEVEVAEMAADKEEEAAIQTETAAEITGTKEEVMVEVLVEAEEVEISTLDLLGAQSPLLIPSPIASGASINPEVVKVKGKWQLQVAEDLGVRSSLGVILSNINSGATISRGGKVVLQLL